MDFLDPVKKRAHKRRLFIGYFLIGVALLLASVILLMTAYGYDLDRKTRQVIQNGLIFVDSNPEKSTIYLNGKENGSTDKRLTVPAGKYTLELKRDGYRTWSKTFELEGSSIERLNYPILFPEKLDTSNIPGLSYETAPLFTSQSPDRKWILIANSLTKFDVLNANDPKADIVKIEIPKEIMTVSKDPRNITPVEWSNDNRHLLIKHTFGNKYEYIMLDREVPNSSINVTNTLGINPNKISMRDKKYDQLYLLDNTSLKFADLKSKQISLYLENVIEYKSYSDNVMLFASIDPSDPNKVIVKMKENNKEYTLRSGNKSDGYILDIARYDDHWYLAVATAGKVFIYRDPNIRSTNSKDLPSLFTTLVIANPSQVLFSSNTRYIMVQSGNKFAIYDAETNRRHYYDIDLSIEVSNKARWMDGSHLVFSHANKVIVMDYDGTNRQELVDVANNNLGFFDRDYIRLYSLNTSIVNGKTTSNMTFTNTKVNR